MKLNLNVNRTIALSTVEYGDVVITEEGNSFLIVRDSDGSDYVGVNLMTNETSEYNTTVYGLFEDEIEETVIQIIKADKLVMGVC